MKLSQHDQRQENSRIGYLDGWRGIAILLVLWGHFSPIKGIDLGPMGVDFFFVLSGRLMAEILFVRKLALPEFFFRRFSRVYPGLLAFIILAAVLFHFTPVHVGLLAMLTALTFTINYTSIYFHHTGLFDHIWSLCIEEHSYLILGALACLERRYKSVNARAIILVIGILAVMNGVFQTAILGHGYFDVYWRTDVQCAPIFLAAYFFLKNPRGGSVYLTPLFLLCALFFKSELFGDSIIYSVGTIFLALSMCFLDTAPVLFKRLLSVAPLRQIGIWSYSIYLWQQPFFQLINKGYGPTYGLFIAAIFAGLLSFYFIERPLRAFLNARKFFEYPEQAQSAPEDVLVAE